MAEKEKLLFTSNFSFSHSVLKRLLLQTRKNKSLFGKGLNSKYGISNWQNRFVNLSYHQTKERNLAFYTPIVYRLQCYWRNHLSLSLFFSLCLFNRSLKKPLFLRACSIRSLKTLQEKEKLLVTSNFSFSHNVFYPLAQLSAIFIKFRIVFWKLFQSGRV